MNYLIVGLGAALGGMLRYGITGFVQRFMPVTFPYGTLAVNLLGSFLLGVIMFSMDAREMISPEVRLFLTIGFCGGFTTFSTFSYETVNLLRDSEFFYAGLNILLSVVLCIAGVYLAYLMSKIWS